MEEANGVRNIDRLCAMWQAINPNTYVTGQAATNDTVTTAEGTIENISTPLTPFWKTPDAFYTSSDVRRTERFGNAYPETQPWRFQSTRDYQASVRTAFRDLYGGSNLAFILASAQRDGTLSSDAQIQLPQAKTQAAEAEINTPQALNQAGSILQGSIKKLASISASVVSSGQHGHDGKQVPLRNTGNPHDGKGHDSPKDPKAPQDTKDTIKDAEPSRQDKGEGASNDGKSHREPEHQSKSRGAIEGV